MILSFQLHVHMPKHVKKNGKAELIFCSTLTKCAIGIIKFIDNRNQEFSKYKFSYHINF